MSDPIKLPTFVEPDSWQPEKWQVLEADRTPVVVSIPTEERALEISSALNRAPLLEQAVKAIESYIHWEPVFDLFTKVLDDYEAADQGDDDGE